MFSNDGNMVDLKQSLSYSIFSVDEVKFKPTVNILPKTSNFSPFLEQYANFFPVIFYSNTIQNLYCIFQNGEKSQKCLNSLYEIFLMFCMKLCKIELTDNKENRKKFIKNMKNINELQEHCHFFMASL